MRVVVVGASGNVGTALLRRFADDGTVTSVVGVARRVPRSPPPAPYAAATWVAVRRRGPAAVDALAAAFAGADAVVQLAWAIQPQPRPPPAARRERRGAPGTSSTRPAAPGCAHVVVASRVGAYSPAPDDVPRGEGWATDGVRSSSYSVDKASVERVLDEIGRYPTSTIARLRPALVFQRSAGHQVSRVLPRPVGAEARGRRVPLGAAVAAGLRLQVVHADDVASAFREAVVRRVRGPFNVAGPGRAARPGPRRRRVRAGGCSRCRSRRPGAVLAVGWHARAVPVGPGWLDMALAAPLLDTSRAAARARLAAHVVRHRHRAGARRRDRGRRRDGEPAAAAAATR